MLSADQIQVFLATVEHGSFSAAARALNRSQTAISYAIQNLEDQLGLRLFNRTSHRPTLTPAGAALLNDAHKVAFGLKNLEAHATAIVRGVETELSIAIDAYFNAELLIPALRDFAARFPQTQLALHQEMIGEALELVRTGACIFGVVSHPLSLRADFAQKPIRDSKVHMTPVSIPTHPLARMQGEIAAHHLVEHIQIVSILDLPMEHGLFSPRLWRCANLTTQRAVILAGIGWSAMPLHIVADDLAAGRLVQLPIVVWADLGRSDFDMNVVHLTESRLGPAARWLVDRIARGDNADTSADQDS